MTEAMVTEVPYLRLKILRLKERDFSWTVRDLMIGMIPEDLILEILFPKVSESVLDRVRLEVRSWRISTGKAMALLRTLKFVELGLVNTHRIKNPEDVSGIMNLMVREAKDGVLDHSDSLRCRISRATHEAVLGLPACKLEEVIESDRIAVEAFYRVTGIVSHPESLTGWSIPPALIAARMWTLDENEARVFLETNEDQIKSNLIESKTMRTLAIRMPGFLEYLGFDTKDLDALVEEYVAQLKDEVNEAAVMRWTPRLTYN